MCAGRLGGGDALAPWVAGCRAALRGPGKSSARVNPAQGRGEQSQHHPGLQPMPPGLCRSCALGARVGGSPVLLPDPIWGIQLQAKVGSHPAFPGALLVTLSPWGHWV